MDTNVDCQFCEGTWDFVDENIVGKDAYYQGEFFSLLFPDIFAKQPNNVVSVHRKAAAFARNPPDAKSESACEVTEVTEVFERDESSGSYSA